MKLIESIDKGTLSLTEWEAVDCEGIDSKHIQKLVKAANTQRDKNLWVLRPDGYSFNTFRATSYIGICSFNPIEIEGKHLKQIIILPKIYKRSNGEKERWADFLTMMEIAYGFKISLSKDEPKLNKCTNLSSLFAAIYTILVEELLRRIRRSYAIRKEQLHSRMRGKLLVGAYVHESLAHCRPQDPVCQFYELTGDTPLNRIIKAGLRVARSLLHEFGGGEWTGRVNKCLAQLYAVADVRITSTDFARIHIHSHNRHYRDPVELASLLINNSCPDFAGGTVGVRGFFLDMNDLFEKFVAGLFLKAGYPIHYQTIGYIRQIFVPNKSHNLVPDVLIQSDEITLVIDAKYKKAFESSYADDETVIGTNSDVKVYMSDIYQMNTYLDVYGENRNVIGIIVYPGGIESDIKVEKLPDKNIWLMPIDLFRKDFRDFGLSDRLIKIIASSTS